MKNNILVIKHGALGDVILAGAAMQAIRQHHKGDCIVCLTTSAFEKLLKSSPWFDMVFIDSKPQWNDFKGWQTLKVFFKKYNFSKVYDLQTSYRSNLYFFFFFYLKNIDWSGIALGCNLKHVNKNRKFIHTLQRQKDQLKIAGVEYNKTPNWEWLIKNYNNDNIIPNNRFVILVSGAAKHRNNKKWSGKNYADLIEFIAKIGIQSILIGSKEESDNINNIITYINKSIPIPPLNYAGKTSIKDIAFLSSNAIGAVGNDTGPMHLISSCGLKTIVLFGSGSNPDLCAPIGKNVSIISKDNINDIKVTQVFKLFKNIVID
jgi:ADP-heptose:LPS heptosyltransferase